jgi:hypothetical protein
MLASACLQISFRRMTQDMKTSAAQSSGKVSGVQGISMAKVSILPAAHLYRMSSQVIDRLLSIIGTTNGYRGRI